MTVKTLGKTVRNQLCIVPVLDKGVDLHGLYYFLGGHLPVFYDDWTCGHVHRNGYAFFELQVYLLQQLRAKSVVGSPT